MDESNPYRSPTTLPPMRRNWPTIISRSIGAIILIYCVAIFLRNGVMSLGILSLGILLLTATSVRDVLFGPNEKQIRRELKERMAAKSTMPTDPAPPSDEFCRGSERD